MTSNTHNPDLEIDGPGNTTLDDVGPGAPIMAIIVAIIVSALIACGAGAAENPDFPDGQVAALEVGQELDTERDLPVDRTWAEIMLPLSTRATLKIGMIEDATTSRPELDTVVDRRISISWSVRFYLGGER